MNSDPREDKASRTVRTRTFDALVANADYRRYFLGHGISLIGAWTQSAAVAWLVQVQTGSEWWLGVTDAAGLLPGVFVGLLAGELADRARPRRMVVAMLVLQALLASGLGLLVSQPSVVIWQVALIVALNRVCVTFEMPSRQVLLYDVVGREHLMNAIALNSGLFNASRMLGPAIAGWVIDRAGVAVCVWLNAVSYLAAILAILSLRIVRSDRVDDPSAAAVSSPDPPSGSRLLGGLAYLKRDRRVGFMFGLMVAFGLMGTGYQALVPSYAQKTLDQGPQGYSRLLSSVGLGALLGALLVASMGGLRRKERLATVGIVIFSFGLAGASFVGRLPDGPIWGWQETRLAAACFCFFLSGFGGILFYSTAQTLIQLAVPDSLRGRIIGLWLIGFSASVPLGSLWAGWVAQRIGVPSVLLLASLLCLGIAAASTLLPSAAAGPKDRATGS